MANRHIDFRTGVWVNLLYPHLDQTMLSPEQENVMTLAETAARTVSVWTKPDSKRTPNDLRYMSWVVKEHET